MFNTGAVHLCLGMCPTWQVLVYLDPPFVPIKICSAGKTIINHSPNHQKWVVKTIPKWVVYYCFTHISGLPYNFSTFTNCLGDLEGVGTWVSRIGWNIIFPNGQWECKTKNLMGISCGISYGWSVRTNNMGIHGLVQKGWIYSNKIWQVPWDKNGSTDVGLPMSTLFLAYAVPLEKGLNLVLPKTTIEALQCFRHECGPKWSCLTWICWKGPRNKRQHSISPKSGFLNIGRIKHHLRALRLNQPMT